MTESEICSIVDESVSCPPRCCPPLPVCILLYFLVVFLVLLPDGKTEEFHFGSARKLFITKRTIGKKRNKKRSKNFFPLNSVLGFKLLDMRACGLVASGFGIAAWGYGWKGSLFLCWCWCWCCVVPRPWAKCNYFKWNYFVWPNAAKQVIVNCSIDFCKFHFKTKFIVNFISNLNRIWSFCDPINCNCKCRLGFSYANKIAQGSQQNV